MTDQIQAQYSTGTSRHVIERALVAAGTDLDHLRPPDLAPVEDFHTMGRIATARLADLAGITAETAVLDAGSGIGGTARYVADRFGCPVTAVDMIQDFCDTATWLNRLVGLDDRISVHRGDVTELPFADGTFQVVLSQHVQMNVVDKPRLYREARRVLADGGRLALWDITDGGHGAPDYPLPWANQSDRSQLAAPDTLRAMIETAGFAIDQWNDLTEPAATTMRAVLALPPQPLGLGAFVPDFADKAKNLTVGLTDGRLRAIQAVARAV